MALAAAIPLIVIGGAASAFYLHLHRRASAMKLGDLPSTSALSHERRILVLSPHCDDETLGAGEMISDARRAGIPVTVAFLTNGDGFRVAASREMREVTVSPGDFVRFAEVRQRESLAALKELGVDAKDIQFLGYPDQGLKPMWEWHWSPATPFRSAYTDHIHCPYPRAYTPQTLYCGQQLMTDLVRLMRTVRPTDVYVTHPSDDHPDHCLAAAFAGAALRVCQESPDDDAWARATQVHYYIVHRGDWPLPQGFHPNLPLLPPSALTGLDTRWSVYRASPEAVAAKRRALDRYVSQTSIEGRFLRSFLRPNEIFGYLRPCDVFLDPSVSPVSRTSHSIPPAAVAEDPVGDDLIRYSTPGADLTEISVRAVPAQRALQIRVSTYGRVSRRVRYTLLLRTMRLGNAEKVRSRFVSLSLAPTAAEMRAGARSLQTTVPLASLGLDGAGTGAYVWVSAETKLVSRLPVIDRVGYRAFHLDGSVLEPIVPTSVAAAGEGPATRQKSPPAPNNGGEGSDKADKGPGM